MRTAEFFAFIKERHAIYERRAAGKPKPWTDDLILQTYKFCNVYRELDTGTKWFAEGWRKEGAKNDNLFFASLLYRVVNWPETMEEIGYPDPWDPEQFIDVIEDRKRLRMKCYSGAYMISTHGIKEPKHVYLAKSLTKIWEKRGYFYAAPHENLSEFHKRLTEAFDIGSFLAGQVVADCKYAGNMSTAPDWYVFAASGPGSRRGLSRVYRLDKATPWKEDDWYASLILLKKEIDPLIKAAKMPKMHAQDLQNCLCEFDKYERVRLGEGRPKSKYPGV